MNRVLVNSDYLSDIADSIREKKGYTDKASYPISPSNMAGEIDTIQTGIEPTGTLEITENGVKDVTEYASVNVDVPVGVFPEGTLDITENGAKNVRTYEAVNVNVPVGVFPEGTLEITENGTSDVTEYAAVDVNVPTGVFPEGTLEITENGAKNVRTYDAVNVNVPTGVFPEGALEITENGEKDVTDYETVNVAVPVGVFPEGTLEIGENGTYEVAEYENVEVNVSGGGGGGDDPWGWVVGDGHNRFHIRLFKPTQIFIPVYSKTRPYNIIVDWGDGTIDRADVSATESLFHQMTHSYENPGRYVIEVYQDGAKTIYFDTGRRCVDSNITEYLSFYVRDVIEKAECYFVPNSTMLNNCAEVYIDCGGEDASFGKYIAQGLQRIKFVNYSSLTLGYEAFYNDRALSEVIGDPSAPCINKGEIFYGCEALREMPALNLKTFENKSFYNCHSLRYINVPEGITTIGESCFDKIDANIQVELPSTVTTIGRWAFRASSPSSGAINVLICKPTVPPTIQSTSFSFTTGFTNFPKIIVPYSEDHSILEAYKTATNWASYADYMVEEVM